MEQKFKDLVFLLKTGVFTENAKKLLSQSLFYYCSGKDPTPIVHLYDKFPLFVYVDSFEYIYQSFNDTSALLYARLTKKGFYMLTHIFVMLFITIVFKKWSLLSGKRHQANIFLFCL